MRVLVQRQFKQGLRPACALLRALRPLFERPPANQLPCSLTMPALQAFKRQQSMRQASLNGGSTSGSVQRRSSFRAQKARDKLR